MICGRIRLRIQLRMFILRRKSCPLTPLIFNGLYITGRRILDIFESGLEFGWHCIVNCDGYGSKVLLNIRLRLIKIDILYRKFIV